MIFNSHIRTLFCGLLLLLVSTVLPAPLCADDALVHTTVTGLTGEALRNVEAAVVPPAGIVHQGKVNERWFKRFLKEIPTKVSSALEPFGYYRSRTTVKTVQDPSGGYGIQVTVDPGPVVRIRNLTIHLTGDGNKNKQIRRARRDFPLKQGDVLQHQVYEKGKLDLRLAANDEGYIKAAFEQHTILVYPEEDAADIELELATGALYYFGETELVDKSGLFTEDFLRRFLGYRDGNIFSHKLLQRTRLNFYKANRFAEVQVIPLIEEAQGARIPVRIELVAGPQKRLRPGIGYGTNSGARLSLSYQDMNVGDQAHAFESDLSLAERRQMFDNSYTIPLDGSADDNLIASAGYQFEDTETFKSEILYTEAERAYGLRPNETGSVYLRYQRENYTVGEDSGIAHMTMPGLRYYLRAFDDPLNPNRGYQVRLELRGVHEALLSDITIGQILAAGRYIRPLGRRLSLLTRIDGALTLKAEEIAKIPPSLRFFIGGDNSVRGYKYKSEGPRDSNGDVVGSDSMLVGSIELEYALTDDWGVAVFYDIGSAYNAFNNIRFIEGAGIGIRRHTPIGPIKVDLASKIGEDPSSLRLHISIGFDI